MTDKIPTSKELILLAEHDWHNREERRGMHERVPWVAGWITGFLSTEKPAWNKILEGRVRVDEREKVLDLVDHAIAFCPNRTLCLSRLADIREGNYIREEAEGLK